VEKLHQKQKTEEKTGCKGKEILNLNKKKKGRNPPPGGENREGGENFQAWGGGNLFPGRKEKKREQGGPAEN